MKPICSAYRDKHITVFIAITSHWILWGKYATESEVSTSCEKHNSHFRRHICSSSLV